MRSTTFFERIWRTLRSLRDGLPYIFLDKNWDIYADWLVSSKKDFVKAKSEFALAKEKAVVSEIGKYS